MKKTKEDKEWSRKVKERDGFKCQINGCEKTRLNSHHIIPWQYKETRTDLMNGITLCVSHHTFGKKSAHKNALWFSNWLRENKPDLYNYLMEKINEY